MICMFKCQWKNFKAIINSKEFQLLEWYIQFKFTEAGLYCNFPKGSYTDKLTIIGKDKNFAPYSVKIIW